MFMKMRRAAIAAGLVGLTAISGPSLSAVAAPAWDTASPANLLYDQNNGDAHTGALSERSRADRMRGSMGAADFTVPAGQTWSIDDFSVTGVYRGPHSQAKSVTVVVFADADGVPGARIAQFTRVKVFQSPSFRLATHGRVPPLSAGTYWFSARVNGSRMWTKFWGWEATLNQHAAPGVWRNPRDGFKTGCTTWSALQDCYGSDIGPDFMFSISGTVA